MKWIMIALLASSPVLAAESGYPREIRMGFLDKCVGLNQELVEPCKCILQGLETHIDYETFADKVLKTPDPMQDSRVKAIAQQCAFKSNGQQSR